MILIPTDYKTQEKLLLTRSLFYIFQQDDFGPFRDWIDRETKRLDVANRKEPDIDTFRIRQGALQTLEALTYLMANASGFYDKLKTLEQEEKGR